MEHPIERGEGPLRRRERRSREAVREALIEAAATLAAERGSGHVTVRDIATRADVNATFVHRYFGSKRNLMRAAMVRAQERVLVRIEEMPDVIEGAATVVHATLQEREFLATLVRARLDGLFADIPAGSPAMTRLLERFQEEVTEQGVPGRHDARVVVACLSAATAGYALLGDYIRHGTGLDGRPDEEVESLLVAILKDVARLAFPA